MSELDYDGSNYIPPQVAVVVGKVLRAPREFGHSVQFSDLFSPFQSERKAYVDGLSAVPVIFFSLFFAWVFITLLLKFKGAEVGCASGRAFVSVRSDDDDDDDESDASDDEKPESDLASTSESSNAETISESSVKPLFLGPGGEMMENSDADIIHDEKDHCGKKFLRFVRRNNTKKETKGSGINKVERRTRFSFLVFASIALICAPLNLFLTFGPLREVIEETSTNERPDSLYMTIQNVLEEIQTSLATIDSLSEDAIELINTVPTELEAVCPLLNSTDWESMIGVDINEIIETIVQQQYNLEEEIEVRLSIRHSFADRMEDHLSSYETIIDESEKFLWILPGLLLTVIILTVTSITGVILAWKEKSGTRFQRVLSYLVLPFLILVAIACWIVVMAFSLSTMIGTDICMSGSFQGTPDQTIEEILSTVGNETDGFMHHFASTYVNHCEANGPTRDINEIKLETQEHIDNIWRQMSKIDSVGRAMAIERCGDTEEFTEMLSGARSLAMTLTDIRRSLSSLEEATECSSIHPIYTEIAHDIVCTQTLSASGYGFVTFLIMWVCMMAMISLRASWLRSNSEEEKNYHDETEVAENMVVDEHEEYLAYISRYKHEWQEYEGFEEDGVVTPSPRSDFHESQRPGVSEDSDHQYYYGDDEEELVSQVSKSDLSTLDSRSLYPQEGPQEIYQRQITTNEIMDQHDDGNSYASGEISFASLSSAINKDVLRLESILTLPPPMNPEYTKDKPQGPADKNPLSTDPIKKRKKKCDPPAEEFKPDFEKNLTEHLQISDEEVEVQINEL